MKIKNRLLLTHGLLVLLALVMVVVNTMAYRGMDDDSRIVNDLGRLRALSFNMGWIAGELNCRAGANDHEEMRKSLTLRKEEFENIIGGFERGVALKSAKSADELRAIAEKWEEVFKPAYVKIIDNNAADADYRLLSMNVEFFVKEINKMVAGYSEYAQQKVNSALGINAALLLLLVGVTIYSLVTMNARIRRPIAMLMDELKELSFIDDELAQRLYNINADELEEMSQYFGAMTYDQLTRVYNRRAGLSKLSKIISVENRRQLNMSLCFVDINGLKEVNDSLGHKSGDELIIAVAECIKAGIREDDYVIRMGGDEFLIVFSGIGVEDSEKVWARINACFKNINKIEKRPYVISVSHGIVEYEKGGARSLDDLIKEADEKMYEEKRIIKKELAEGIVRENE